jgi:ELWxxDGT repeat protein
MVSSESIYFTAKTGAEENTRQLFNFNTSTDTVTQITNFSYNGFISTASPFYRIELLNQKLYFTLRKHYVDDTETQIYSVDNKTLALLEIENTSYKYQLGINKLGHYLAYFTPGSRVNLINDQTGAHKDFPSLDEKSKVKSAILNFAHLYNGKIIFLSKEIFDGDKIEEEKNLYNFESSIHNLISFDPISEELTTLETYFYPNLTSVGSTATSQGTLIRTPYIGRDYMASGYRLIKGNSSITNPISNSPEKVTYKGSAIIGTEFTYEGRLFFQAFTPETGYEFYTYDPSSNQTSFTSDLNPGVGNIEYESHFEVNSSLYVIFSTGWGRAHLYKYNQNENMFELVIDKNGSSPTLGNGTHAINNSKIYVFPYEDYDIKYIFEYDTSSNTFTNLTTEKNLDEIGDFHYGFHPHIQNGKMYFSIEIPSYSDDYTSGSSLFSFDLVTKEFQQLQSIEIEHSESDSGDHLSLSNKFVEYNGNLYVMGNTEQGYGIYRYNIHANNLTLVYQNEDYELDEPQYYNGSIYFSGDAGEEYVIIKFDLSSETASVFLEDAPLERMKELTLIDNKLYLNFNDPNSELYGALGSFNLDTEEFSHIPLINPTYNNSNNYYSRKPDLYPSNFFKLGGKIYFKGKSNQYGREYFRFTP